MLLKKYLFAISVFCCVSGSFAALPPQYAAQERMSAISAAQEQRKNALDVVRIKVVEANLKIEENDRCPAIEYWKIKARVEEVLRGSLAQGDTVDITYTRRINFCPGPEIFTPGQLLDLTIYEAYLNCSGKQCSLAAGAWSFHSENEFNNELDESQSDYNYWKKEL